MFSIFFKIKIIKNIKTKSKHIIILLKNVIEIFNPNNL